LEDKFFIFVKNKFFCEDFVCFPETTENPQVIFWQKSKIKKQAIFAPSDA